MSGRVRALWADLRASYWFIPSVLAGSAIGLSFIMIEVDHVANDDAMEGIRWVMRASADGVRALLQTIAGSMITVAGTVFSITIIALSLASQQFGPRLLRNFMRDRGNQIVLGTFIATFLYCILILRTVSSEEPVFIPQFGAMVAVALAVLSVMVLIYFIHHVAISIQAPYIIANVARELEEEIDGLFPESLGDDAAEEPPHTAMPTDFDSRSATVHFDGSGYLQSISEDALMKAASEHDLVARLRVRLGSFVLYGQPCMDVWPADRLNDEVTAQLRATFTLKRARTAEQDVSFAIDQVVEIAARSLSPSLNDPFTAIACIDRLGAAFAHMASRRMPSPFRVDGDGRLRVIAEPFRLGELVVQSIEPIRQYGSSHALVVLSLLNTLGKVGPHVRRAEDRTALLTEIDRIEAAAIEAQANDPQRRRISDTAELARRGVRDRFAPDAAPSGNPLT